MGDVAGFVLCNSLALRAAMDFTLLSQWAAVAENASPQLPAALGLQLRATTSLSSGDLVAKVAPSPLTTSP